MKYDLEKFRNVIREMLEKEGEYNCITYNVESQEVTIRSEKFESNADEFVLCDTNEGLKNKDDIKRRVNVMDMTAGRKMMNFNFIIREKDTILEYLNLGLKKLDDKEEFKIFFEVFEQKPIALLLGDMEHVVDERNLLIFSLKKSEKEDKEYGWDDILKYNNIL